MKIRLSKDEIKAIVLNSLQASMPNISEKDVSMDDEGIEINTSLGDALGVNITAPAPKARRGRKPATEEAAPVTPAIAPEPEMNQEEEDMQEETASNDNSITGILEGNKEPKGLFDD